MGYDLYLKKVNKNKLEEKTKYMSLNELSFDDLEYITEDEVNSFINVFESYFDSKRIHYKMEDYHVLTNEEFINMKDYLEGQLSVPSDETDWTYRMQKMVYEYMDKWKNDLEDNVIVFEHDC